MQKVRFQSSLIIALLFSLFGKSQCNLTASFTATPDTVGSTNYTLTGTWQGANVVSGFFSINPGPVIYGTNVTYNFPVGGSYVVCFTVSDTLTNFPGCTATFCDSLVIGSPASCGSYISVTNNGGGNFTFTATPNVPSSYLVSYLWSFGDGTSSTANPANHTYLTNGTYAVSVLTTAVDSTNNTITCSGTSYITVVAQGGSNTGGTMNCQALFSSTNAGSTFTFLNQSSCNDSLASSSSYWTIDNSFLSALANPVYVATDSLTHVVCLYQNYFNATTGDSCYSVYCDSIGLGSNPSGGGGGGGSNLCNAAFVLWQDTLNLSIYYGYNTSSGGPGMTYLWDFGDGTTSNLAYPSHQYANPGVYTVCLTVIDVNCTSVFCDSAGVYKMMSPGMSQLNILPFTPPSGVQETAVVNKINVAPNPLTDNSLLSFESVKSGQLDLQITDYAGRRVAVQILNYSSGKNNFSLPVAELSRGIYFLTLSDALGLHQTLKLIR